MIGGMYATHTLLVNSDTDLYVHKSGVQTVGLELSVGPVLLTHRTYHVSFCACMHAYAYIGIYVIYMYII